MDKTQHEGGENADSGDQQRRISDEKMQKEVSDKILRSFYNSKYPDAAQQAPETQNIFQTLSDQAPQIASCLLTDIPHFSPAGPAAFDGGSAFVDSQLSGELSRQQAQYPPAFPQAQASLSPASQPFSSSLHGSQQQHNSSIFSQNFIQQEDDYAQKRSTGGAASPSSFSQPG